MASPFWKFHVVRGRGGSAETIDRMRFDSDMDELRNAMTSVVMAEGSGVSRAANSISKSLGEELVGKTKVQWVEEVGEEEEPFLEASEEHKTVKRGLTVVSAPEPREGTDGEDVIRTIITPKTRVGKSSSHSLCKGFGGVERGTLWGGGRVLTKVNKNGSGPH